MVQRSTESARGEWYVFLFVCCSFLGSAALVGLHLSGHGHGPKAEAEAVGAAGARPKDPRVLEEKFRSGWFSSRRAWYYEEVGRAEP